MLAKKKRVEINTERQDGTAESAAAAAATHMRDNLKQHDDEEYPTGRSMSIESFEQTMPSDHKLSPQQHQKQQQQQQQLQMKPIQHANDRLMQNKLNAQYDHAKNRTKSPEKLRQQSDRSFDDQNRRYQFQADVVIHDEHVRHKENIGQQKDLESNGHPEKNTCSSVVVNVSSGGGAELRRPRTIRETDSKRIITPVSTAIAEQQVQPLPPATSTVFSTGRRKIRLSRQLHSMSSSEDELPSTSNGNNEDILPRIDAEISSEKDILRYIYGSQKMRSGRKC
uniref:Uncharacterized protein n=1 Tax=Elaeophora elaphi TaxID=1147741 RepID=A0A0R3RJU0_9BILA